MVYFSAPSFNLGVFSDSGAMQDPASAPVTGFNLVYNQKICAWQHTNYVVDNSQTLKIYKNLDLKAIKLWCCSMCELKCMSVLYYCSMHNKNNNNYHTQLQVEQHNLISNYYMRNNLLPLGNVCFSKGYVWCMNWVMIIASNRWGKR